MNVSYVHMHMHHVHVYVHVQALVAGRLSALGVCETLRYLADGLDTACDVRSSGITVPECGAAASPERSHAEISHEER